MTKTEQWHIVTLDELRDIVLLVQQEASALKSVGATVITLRGDLGAGKTAFTKLLATTLGVADTVTSPTFVVMKQYELENANWSSLVHIDAYRIETIDEAGPLRLEELLREPHTLVCIEWPEQISSLIPEVRIDIQFELHADESRTVTMTTYHGN
jgi:tRNA threonylcarbamoyladenosine biosynthesis protein TsaE